MATHLHLVPELRMSENIRFKTPYANELWCFIRHKEIFIVVKHLCGNITREGIKTVISLFMEKRDMDKLKARSRKVLFDPPPKK
jgi:hypothetical protein